MMMHSGQKIVVMCGSQQFATFQPRPKPQPAFGGIIVRVVQQPGAGVAKPQAPPNLDFLSHILASQIAPVRQTHGRLELPKPTLSLVPKAAASTHDHDASERLAREMQEEEMQGFAAQQFGKFLMSLGLFDDSDDEDEATPVFRERPVNAEAGPSTVVKPPSPSKLTPPFKLGSPAKNLYHSQAITEEVEPRDKKSGKKRARTGFDPATCNPSSVLDKIEIALRREIKQFDFPEQVDFLEGNSSPGGTPPAPQLSHTPNNAGVHAFEKALLGLRDNLWLVRDNPDESVIERRLQLEEQIRYELEDLDRRVLEAWAAKRRYTPSPSPECE